MKPILVTSALTIAIAALFAIGSSPLVFAARYKSYYYRGSQPFKFGRIPTRERTGDA